jgi:hypothetical protein
LIFSPCSRDSDRSRHTYDQQPYGFRSDVYFGETSICIPLFDPQGEIAQLKKSVDFGSPPTRQNQFENSEIQVVKSDLTVVNN